eukprot:1299069-Rhodomonas_salina.1
MRIRSTQAAAALADAKLPPQRASGWSEPGPGRPGSDLRQGDHWQPASRTSLKREYRDYYY